MSTPVRRALYGRLAGDTILNGMLATPPTGFAKNIYYQDAPADAHYPLVILSKQSGVPTEAFADPDALDTDVWLVKGIDRNTTADTAEAIQARIQVLLNDATLTISAATHLYLRRESDVEYPEDADGEQFKHAGSLYRLVYDPA